ncbi:MAG: L-2-amino-thiazoline-4-carboxylic acid hydrolase [Clostridia bacterium]|nr:L-2-amino-thiazoline-4-carboxylic acid hydrolase [Clostridia bacterium]
MKYSGMPMGMWLLFGGSFRKNLTEVYGYNKTEAKEMTKQAKKRYKKIITFLPDFEKGDRFKMNIVSCAQFAAFYLQLKDKPTLEKTTEYYNKSMMTKPMKLFCRMSGKRKFSKSDIEGMKETAKFRAADRNPYSWNMRFELFEDGSGYCAKFTKCGICALLEKLGIYEVTPALCALDYAMSDAGMASVFTRKYTLASGGPYCDCNYHKKQ